MESEELSVDSFVCVDDPVPPCNSGKGGSKRGDGKRKRRFSDEQIKSLECTFEAQTKLEPRKKLQLASELGLQPRQVAIWFQNKRARWKSKQLEREYGALRADYDALRADYDALLSSFESVKKEKQSLAKKLQKLAEVLKKPMAGSRDGGDSDRGRAEGDEDRKPSWVSEGSELTLMVCSAEEKLAGHVQKQEPSFYAGDVHVDGCLGLAGGQRSYFEAGGGFSDQSCGSPSDWWAFWTMNE